MPGPGAFEAVGVQKTYRVSGRTFQALRGVDLSLEAAHRVGIVGESGSGKSTLARLLVGFEQPSAGRVLHDGREIAEHLATTEARMHFRRRVQLVAQDTSSSFNPRRTLRESVEFPARRLRGLPAAAARQRADRVLDLLELPRSLAERTPREVSGGQRQRFSIARALVVEPSTLLCDEAVSALDVSVQGSVLNHLKDYSTESGCGIVFVSHGLPATVFLCERLVVMCDGEIVETGLTREILDAPRHPYTRSLLAAYRAERSGTAA